MTEQVLKGAEVDNGPTAVYFCGVEIGVAREVLPSVEVSMRFEVALPCIFDSGLECDDEYAFSTELFGELVGGEGFAEAHLGVPKESRNGVLVFIPDGVKVGVSFVDRFGLFAAHGEGGVMGACKSLAGA